MYPQGHLKELEISRERSRQEREAIRAEQIRPLTQKISDWWEALPQEQRTSQYTMESLRNIFGVSGSRIGPALIALGWTRGRSWRSEGSYYRYWRPPG
jgi:hypothetical protein